MPVKTLWSLPLTWGPHVWSSELQETALAKAMRLHLPNTLSILYLFPCLWLQQLQGKAPDHAHPFPWLFPECCLLFPSLLQIPSWIPQGAACAPAMARRSILAENNTRHFLLHFEAFHMDCLNCSWTHVKIGPILQWTKLTQEVQLPCHRVGRWHTWGSTQIMPYFAFCRYNKHHQQKQHWLAERVYSIF